MASPCEDKLNQLINCLDPLIFLLRLIGFDFSLSRQSSSFFWKVMPWLSRSILTAFSLFLLIKLCYSLQAFGIHGKSFTGNELDSFVIYWGFLWIVLFKGPRLVLFTRRLLFTLVSLLPEVDFQLISSFRRFVWGLLFLNLALSSLNIRVCLLHRYQPEALSSSETRKVADGFLTTLVTFSPTFQILNYVIFVTMSMVTDAVIVYVIVTLYALGLSFGQVLRAGTQVEGHMRLQLSHRKLAIAVKEFNELFNPLVLCIAASRFSSVLLCLITLTVLYILAVPIISIMSIVMIFKPLVLLLPLLHQAHLVHRNSKNFFRFLLTNCLGNCESSDCDAKTLIQNCSVCTLSVCTWMTTPPTITASGWFTIDYRLIALIVTVNCSVFAITASALAN